MLGDQTPLRKRGKDTVEGERAKCLQRILDSDATHKLVIAGPGTGKTYTFGRLLEKDPGNSLVLTLINNLVDEMQKEIGELADVRTFHSYSRRKLHEHPFGGITTNFHFFPGLTRIINGDSLILHKAGLLERGYAEDELGIAFRLLIENDGRIEFFLERANYYDAVGFDDSVYRVLSLFNADSGTIPTYHYVMVDEFQDFNELEVTFLASLEDSSRMLIVGDDDQSLYHFRQASPDHLRAKANDARYQRFSLPYCTRCTATVIAAMEHVIEGAQALGLLNDRLDKDFVCYLPEKQADNEAYPKIRIATCSVQRGNAPYISRYIESVVSALPATEVELALKHNYPLALVVGESHYLRQIYDYLSERLSNVVYKPSSRFPITVLDGFGLLLEREDSNLGWRIVLQFLAPEDLEEFVISSAKGRTPLIELVDEPFKAQQLARIEILRRAAEDSDNTSPGEIEALEELFSLPIQEILESVSKPSQDVDQETRSGEEDLSMSEPTILLTTYNGSKGLSAGFTFITGLEENVFPNANDQPSFTEICQLIVALMRTRKQCHLIHTKNFAGKWTNRSVFLDWIPEELSERIQVDKGFF